MEFNVHFIKSQSLDKGLEVFEGVFFLCVFWCSGGVFFPRGMSQDRYFLLKDVILVTQL